MPLGQWKAAWSGAKDEFKDLSGDKKKPDAGKLLGMVSTHKAGVAGALGKADDAYAEYRDAITAFDLGKLKEAKVHDHLNKFGRAVKTAKDSITDYNKTLGAEIGKLKEKGDKELRYKSLKAMTKQLDAISADLDMGQMELFGKFNLARAKAERAAAKAPALTTKEMVEISTDPILKKSVLVNAAKGKAWVAKCAALLKKTPADMTEPLKFFNKEIQKTARDMTQPLTNTVKRLGVVLPPNVKAAEVDLVARNGGGFSLAGGTTAPAYAAELKLLSGHFKNIETWAKSDL
jgi:hypothetical protein